MKLPVSASDFNRTPIAAVTAQATIAKVVKGYRVTVEIRKGAKVYVVVNKIEASIINAEAVAKTFTAEHGVPWHTVEVLYR
jgi:RecG-like helicase